MKNKQIRTIVTIVLFAVGSTGAISQTLYLPGGATDIGNASNQNVGIGTSSAPAEKLHVAGNIQIGSAAPSTSHVYYINMPAGSSTIGGGNGRDLVINAGSSDNQSTVRGGHLYLRPGVPQFPATAYGNIYLADEGGNVGIGTETPQWKLDVNGPLAVKGQAIFNVETNEMQIGDIAGGDGLRDYLHFYTRDTKRMTINQSGNVGIGTTNPDAKLAVKGTVHAEEVKVDLNVPAPDYVFEKNYNLPTLAEVENYINKNKHLPEVPAAKEMEANGVNVGEMNMLLLKKVEELTLYLLEQDKTNQQQVHEIESLKNQLLNAKVK